MAFDSGKYEIEILSQIGIIERIVEDWESSEHLFRPIFEVLVESYRSHILLLQSTGRSKLSSSTLRAAQPVNV
ncbi:unnamed protein product [Trichobilharzia regenti]|nr:unnamed protein product [Trichobilharzia regenti]